ncbi:hypothetical protein SCHPADRAFT_943174 [Schizopora paradoxa]|uniref:Golgi apparatus membrane protein TVP38 n=1 Tax=Schizopora paradoxa TaxID=27342 RepID=A0A0H2REM8_9AGAM|nr:hypothetical protein SCHPADRAFT_943174 [Schizopora paradoxa]
MEYPEHPLIVSHSTPHASMPLREDVETISNIVAIPLTERASPSEYEEEKKRAMEIEVVSNELKTATGDLDVTEDAPSSIKVNVDIVREITRTPSPTPSEAEALQRRGMIHYRSLLKWRFWVRKKWIRYYLVLAAITTVVVLLAVFHTRIALAVQPVGDKIRRLPAGWLIPIALLFVLSFPPLFGHEIIAAICGLVWGVWIGFGIVAAGTYFGEVGNFYAFRLLCRARGEKWERTKINYACLAKIVREGGLKVATIVRWSVIPGHFSTAVFSTCGMSFWVFSFSAIASLPKHFVPVYVGFALGILRADSDAPSIITEKESVKQHVITYSVLAGTVIVTIGAFLYIAKKMEEVKQDVIHARRRRRKEIKVEQLNHTVNMEDPIVVELHPVRSRTSGMTAVA